ncbi:RDD family protein [Virgibacillus siamensis]|uniref:RDD family protein n=1 Tax=Virgibacillus siamensis TaxID=480071 RepID=UPI00098439CB|nr:RDD family protein [Virgibacillus siamensis]
MGNSASIAKRLAALVIDYFLVVVYACILFGLAALFYQFILDGIPDTGRLTRELTAFLTLAFPVFLYFVIMESAAEHATYGKRKMKICIASTDGDSPTLFQVMLRNVIKLLPWQAAHTFIFTGMHQEWTLSGLTWMMVVVFCYGLPILSILFLCFRKDHRVVHDLFAKTVVMKSDHS